MSSQLGPKKMVSQLRHWAIDAQADGCGRHAEILTEAAFYIDCAMTDLNTMSIACSEMINEFKSLNEELEKHGNLNSVMAVSRYQAIQKIIQRLYKGLSDDPVKKTSPDRIN